LFATLNKTNATRGGGFPAAPCNGPLGAQAKEHGHHLPLQNDWLLAEYLKGQVLEALDVVVAPTLNYGFYPAFLEYPGSSSLSRTTARDMIVEICRGWHRHGPRRFYVLNTGISTLLPLRDAAALLAEDGILLRFSDEAVLGAVEHAAAWEQQGGTHADEVETSIMLYISPEAVDMRKAVRDCRPHHPGPLTRDRRGAGTYSPTSAWGDPTRATRAKGRTAVEALLAGIFRQIELLRAEALPAWMIIAPRGAAPRDGERPVTGGREDEPYGRPCGSFFDGHSFPGLRKCSTACIPLCIGRCQ
jgi:creatinine amidohydrolase